jgi:hypothetical protein
VTVGLGVGGGEAFESGRMTGMEIGDTTPETGLGSLGGVSSVMV